MAFKALHHLAPVYCRGLITSSIPVSLLLTLATLTSLMFLNKPASFHLCTRCFLSLEHSCLTSSLSWLLFVNQASAQVSPLQASSSY